MDLKGTEQRVVWRLLGTASEALERDAGIRPTGLPERTGRTGCTFPQTQSNTPHTTSLPLILETFMHIRITEIMLWDAGSCHSDVEMSIGLEGLRR